MERFDDPKLSGWVIEVSGNNNISQSGSQLNISYQDTSVQKIRAYYKVAQGSAKKASISVTVKTPPTPSTAARLPFFCLASDNDGEPVEFLCAYINSNGRIEVEYDTGSVGNKAYVRSVNSYAEQMVKLYIEIDGVSKTFRVLINDDEELHPLDTQPWLGIPYSGSVDYVVFEASGEPYSFVAYAIAFADNIPSSPKYVINGRNVGIFGLKRAWCKNLGVYAYPYFEIDTGLVKVDIRRVSDDSLITTINTGEVINKDDWDHENASVYFINVDGKDWLVIMVRRHHAEGTLILVDPDTWAIKWKATVPNGTYGQVALFENKIAVFQRETLYGRYPLYMHLYTLGGVRFNPVQVVRADKGIFLYPVINGIDNSDDGRYLFVAWTYFDSSTGRRHNIYMIYYDHVTRKWYTWRGVEISLPIVYNDGRALVSTEGRDVGMLVMDAVYLYLHGDGLPVTFKILKYDVNTKTVTTVFDGSPYDLRFITFVHTLYNGSDVVVAGEIDYDGAPFVIRTNILYPYIVVPMATVLLDLESRALVFVPDIDRVNVYEIEWNNTNSPHDEIYMYKVTGAPAVTTVTAPSTMNLVVESLAVSVVLLLLLSLLIRLGGRFAG